METELSADIAEADHKLIEYINSRKFDSAALMSRQMEELADGKLKEVENMKVPSVQEGESFKKSAIRYFTYIKSIYTTFKKFTIAATNAEKEKERKKLAKIIEEKDDITKDMQEAQRKFAAANNFIVGKN